VSNSFPNTTLEFPSTYWRMYQPSQSTYLCWWRWQQ